MDVPDIWKAAKKFGPVLAGQHDIHFSLGQGTLKLDEQWRQQQQVAEPMIRAADQDSVNFRAR
ncbi:MAG: hypothetical protein ACREPZ_01255 [Rhodanobacteraceae bacterium]